MRLRKIIRHLKELSISITLSKVPDELGKGAEKKTVFFMVFCQTPPPPPPPPRYGLFTDKKIYPHFFLEIESMIAKTNFTLGPIEKSIFFVQL